MPRMQEASRQGNVYSPFPQRPSLPSWLLHLPTDTVATLTFRIFPPKVLGPRRGLDLPPIPALVKTALTIRLWQCGEEQPACNNCTRRSTPCNYPVSNATSPRERPRSRPENDHHRVSLLAAANSRGSSSIRRSTQSSRRCA